MMWSERIYRWLLRLYPAPERDRWGADMMATFRRRAAAVSERGAVPRLAFHVREWAGLVAAALRSRMGPVGGPPAPTRDAAGHPSAIGKPDVPRRLGAIGRHARHGARRLARSPTFSLVAVLTLGLGIGATVAIYAVVDGVVVDALPYPDAERLVRLDNAAPGIGSTEGMGFTPGMVHHAVEGQSTLEALAAWDGDEATLTGRGDPERVRTTRATPSLLEVLGVVPLHGRWFVPDDVRPDRAPVAVLNHALWTRRYGGDPAIVGRTVRIDGGPVDVIGVMPGSFRFPDTDVRLWLPMRIDASVDFGGFWYEAVGRMRPGMTPDDVRADLRRLYGTLVSRYPGNARFIRSSLEDARLTPLVTPLRSAIVGDVARTLWILLGAVGFVLLIAYANVANLFLVRAETRQRELAVRAALGAGRRELVRESLSEGVLLSALGGLVGLGLAYAATSLLVAHGPPDLPRLQELDVDGSVLAFAFGVTTLAGLAFAGIPLLRGMPCVVAALKGGPGTSADRPRVRGRNLLVAGQTALALVLLVGSGLMIRSFAHLRSLDPGFQPSPDILTFELGLPRPDHPDDARAAAFLQELVDRIEGLPGVERAGVVTCLPVRGWCAGDPLNVEGRPVPEGTIPPIVALRRAGPGYFRTMGIRRLAGRSFERADHERGRRVVVVSRELARRYFPDEDPLGARVAVGRDTTWSTVVGVVEDVPARDLMEGGDPLVYFPLAGPGFGGVAPHDAAVAVRARDATDLLDGIRARLAELDPDVALARIRTTERIVADAGARLAFTMTLLVIAAGVALLLGAVGIYGVISYLVNRRRAEIGVRMALGARAVDVRRMVVRQGGLVAGAGLVVGGLAALGLGRFMEALVFGVETTDPVTFASVSTVLLAIALIASWVPARRASRIDPAQALRSE